MQAGHMGNLDEIFRVVPNPNKRKETRGQCQFRNCTTRVQGGNGKYCQRHKRKNKICALEGCSKVALRRPGLSYCSEHTEIPSCLYPECDTNAHRSCRGYCYRHRGNEPVKHFCTTCKVITVKRRGTRCAECRKNCRICGRKSVTQFAGGKCRKCNKVVETK